LEKAAIYKKYPKAWTLRNGTPILLRLIEGEDEPMMLELFQSLSEQTIRYRFFEIIRDMPHETLVRYCNIDYDQEVAIVAELTENKRKHLIGVVRLCLDPNRPTGEFAIVIADQWQHQGLGTKMLQEIIAIGKEQHLGTIYGIILTNNYQMLNLMKKLSFQLQYQHDGTVKATKYLKPQTK
jgi:acetyltransferase